MSKIVDDGLKHFRDLLECYKQKVLYCEKEISRLEALSASEKGRPTQRAADGAYCTCENSSFFVSDLGLTCWSCKKPRR